MDNEYDLRSFSPFSRVTYNNLNPFSSSWRLSNFLSIVFLKYSAAFKNLTESIRWQMNYR